jgi:spore germination cell wall hydrolase CwlJ-like protein
MTQVQFRDKGGIHAGPLILLGAVVVALLIVAGLYNIRHAAPPNSIEALRQELGELPAVEPLTLQPVAADEAKKKNAEQPFITGPIPPAKPFAIGGSSADIQRAVDCLAATVYYEAAQEPSQGQLAVMQVVINRMRHPAYPKSICGVVFQGHERRTGCQFSYTCDGSLRRQPSAASWDRYRQMARAMLGGQVYAPVGLATHYHADYVLPYWSASLDKLRVEGRHIFYRWKGGWGTPRAFVGGYRGTETVYPKLALLSPVHRTGDPTLDAMALAMPGASISTMPLDAKLVAGAAAVSDGDKGQYILRIDPGLDAGQLPQLAAQTCGARPYCKVFAWSNTALMPKAFPVAEDQLSTMAFSYLRNEEQAFEKPLWNCAVFPRADKKQCIRKRVIIEGKAQELIPLARPEEEAATAAKPALRPGELRSLSGPDDAAPTIPTAEERTQGRRRPGDPG